MPGAEYAPPVGGEGGQNEFQYLTSTLVDEHFRGASSVVFDPYEELIWICTYSVSSESLFDGHWTDLIL